MNEIAIIGWDKNPWSFEASIFENLSDFAKIPLENHSPFLLIVRTPASLGDIVSHLDPRSLQGRQMILVEAPHISADELLQWSRTLPIVALVDGKDLSRVEDLLNAILLTRRLEDQARAHQNLIKEEESHHEKQYQKLLTDLKTQQEQINEIQSRLLKGLQQEKLLHDTLLILMTSQGFGEIELRLQELLEPFLGALHLRLILHDGSSHPQTAAPPAIAFELHEQDRSLGRMVVHSLEDRRFDRVQLKILETISEALSLHIPRFLAFEANALLETEWRATFDSISDPLILVDDTYKILDANRSARRRMAHLDNSFALPCHQLMFQRSTPCSFCQWNQKSNLEAEPSGPGEQWEMSSHELRNKKNKQKIYVHLYRNRYEQIALEKKITTYAQAAEVGIFKASLAHELNNPIGGLLTLAQLQKMDLTQDHPLYPLVTEIERQALLCRDLIQDLLQRTRKNPAPTPTSSSDL